MVKDLHYIIKRILIGVGIALVLAFLKGGVILNAKAMTVNSQNLGAQTWSVNASTNYWYVNKSFNNIWYNWGPGYVYFNIAISKQNTSSVAPLVSPKSIVLSSSSESYACSFDSSSVNNSTYINQHYSVTCPVNFSNNTGLTLLTVNLLPNNNTPLDTYEIYFDGYMTFVNDSSSVNVNVDNSGSNSNRDQNFGNLINDNRSNTQSINNNNDANTQDIIDNQNSNTQQQIESQKVCTPKSITLENGSLDGSTGSNIVLNNRKRSDYMSVLPNKEYKVSSSSNVGVFVFEYDLNHSFVRFYPAQWANVPYTFTTGNNAKYVRFVFNSNSVNNPVFTGCFNGNQSIVDSQQEINNTLNDSTTSNPDSDLNTMSSKVASNNSITQLLTLPITLFQNVLNNINGTCSSYSLGALYGHNLSLPCINLESILGSTLWGVIDILISGLFILSFRKKMVDIFNHMSSLNDRGNELE